MVWFIGSKLLYVFDQKSFFDGLQAKTNRLETLHLYRISRQPHVGLLQVVLGICRYRYM